MTGSPRWLSGREHWLAGAISVVLVAALTAAVVDEGGDEPLTEEEARACALSAASELTSVASVLRVDPPTDDSGTWTVVVGGDDVVVSLVYRADDGVVSDATIVDRGGASSLGAVARAELLDHVCD